MAVIVSLSIYSISFLGLLALRFWHRPFTLSWSTAALGSVFGWLSVLFWKMELPIGHTYSFSLQNSIFALPLVVSINENNWMLVIALTTLLAVTVLTSPARTGAVEKPSSLIASFSTSSVAILAILSANLTTLILGWVLLDAIELINQIRLTRSDAGLRNALVDYLIKTLAVFFAWLSVSYSGPGTVSLMLSSITDQFAILSIFIAAGVRIGLFPFRLRRISIDNEQLGFGTLLNIVTFITSLAPLLLLNVDQLSALSKTILLLIAGFSGLISAWVWLTETNEDHSQQHFLMAGSSVFIFAIIGLQKLGATSLGSVMALASSVVFLHTANVKRLPAILALCAFLMIGLPFSYTATLYSVSLPLAIIYQLLFGLINTMAVGGFLRRVLAPKSIDLEESPLWAQTTYPAGLALGPIVCLLFGLWGWQGAFQIGTVWVGAFSAIVLSGTLIFVWRSRNILATISGIRFELVTGSLTRIEELIRSIFGFFFSSLEGLFRMLSLVLEGDGGWFWVGLFLVLVVLLARGA